MKIALYSDLHMEHMFGEWTPTATEADVVILAGDIGSHTHGLYWASDAFPGKQVIYVPGNHEYDGAGLGLLSEMRRVAKQFGIRLLERDVVELPDIAYTDTDMVTRGQVRFLGCTLWNGFSLHETVEGSMAIAKRCINDYALIKARHGKSLEPRDTLAMHRTAVRWLQEELSKPFDGRTVVVTHFAPHPLCVPPQFQDSALSPYSVTDLAWLMERHPIELWCFGHTHTNQDFITGRGCRVVSNQRGYPNESEVLASFRDDLVMEV